MLPCYVFELYTGISFISAGHEIILFAKLVDTILECFVSH